MSYQAEAKAACAKANPAASAIQLAMMINERSAGARREHDLEIPCFPIELVMLTVGRVPRNLRIADRRGNGIHGVVVVVDIDLPVRPARIIGAGDGDGSGVADH